MAHPIFGIFRITASPFRLTVPAALAVLAAQAAWAHDSAPAGVAGTMAIDDAGSGTLLLRTKVPGRYLPAPLVMTEVRMRVSGMVARVELRQMFHNPSEMWLEGVYAFPLPENASVDRMRLEVGDEVIEAGIAEREAARQAYQQARTEGRRAALVEQHRPNIFTNAVANIAPGETVTVELRYQHTLRYDGGRFHLRFPMVVAPRYRPGPLTVARAESGGWATRTKSAETEDGLESPVLRPEAGPVNPVSLRVELDAGVRLAALASSYHTIETDDWRNGTATVTLADGAVPADRDFELAWTPETGTAPVAGIFRETIGDDAYVLVMVLPPARATGPVPPRDVVFVLDRSGSMAGTSIVQARAAFAAALARLRPIDRFNVIRFNDRLDALFAGVRPASRESLARAAAYVEATDADGGTEMMPALIAALSGTVEAGRLRQVVFLTDGAVANEADLLREIEARIGATRLFTIGIGSAPNSHFMTAAARSGRGTFTYIGALEEVAERTGALFAKLEQPAVTDLQPRWTAGAGPMSAVDAYPKLPPDLYLGEPLVLAAKLDLKAASDTDATLHLTGLQDGVQWRHALRLAGAREAAGIGAVWGRARIEALMGSLHRGADAEAVREAVTETALRHRLVSRYTSLVAVQDRVARPDGTPVTRTRVPLNLPAGWEYDKVFGESLLKAAPPASGAPAEPIRASATPVMLPQGAAGWEIRLWIGVALLLSAVLLLAWMRRRV